MSRGFLEIELDEDTGSLMYLASDSISSFYVVQNADAQELDYNFDTGEIIYDNPYQVAIQAGQSAVPLFKGSYEQCVAYARMFKKKLVESLNEEATMTINHKHDK